MKCYICLTESIATRKDYLDLLEVTLISARRNTTLRMICLYDGPTNNTICHLLQKYDIEIIYHELPYKQALMDIYPKEWMQVHLGKEIEYSRIFGTFMRMEIPMIEKEDQWVLYTDMDVIFNKDIHLEELPHPAYLAAAPEFEQDTEKMEYFNAGILLMNIEGMKEKYAEFIEKLKRKERNTFNLFDQGYLNELCFKDMDVLPLEYNWKPYWGINPNAKIIHFHGMKPGSSLTEAGFATNNQFYRMVFEQNSNGYEGYVYYFLHFFNYLGRKEEPWLFHHLQEIFNLYRDPKFLFPQEPVYKQKYKKYKRLYQITLTIFCILIIITILIHILPYL